MFIGIKEIVREGGERERERERERESTSESLHAKLRKRMGPDDSVNGTIAGSFRRVSPNDHQHVTTRPV